MENNYLSLLISFVVANLAIFLLLPNIYSGSKSLLEYIWNNKEISDKLTKTIENYFSLIDLINYNTISFSLCMFISGIILISEQISDNISIDYLRYCLFILVIVYTLWILFGIYKAKNKRMDIGKKGFKQGFVILIFTTIIYIIVTNLWIFKHYQSQTLILLYFVIIAVHLFTMLLPLFYMPLSSILMEKKKQKGLSKKMKNAKPL